MSLKLLNSIIFFFLTGFISGQQNDLVQSKIDNILASTEFKHANVSISVVDITSNQLIGSHRPEKVLVPASSLKLFTTLSSLVKLGKDYQFQTKVEYDGVVDEDGTLQGNLFITGGGDPTFGSDKFSNNYSFEALLEGISTKIIEAGITCINGLIVADESIFDSYPVAPSWQWNDLGNYYASGAWGLNVNENLYYIHFDKRNNIGSQPSIYKVYPFVPNLSLSNEIIIDSSHTGDNAYIFGGPYNFYKRIVGTIPKGTGLFTIKGSIPDPPLFLAYHIRNNLDYHNVQSNGSEAKYKADYHKRTELCSYYSPPLKEIIRLTNVESNNLYAECILKMMGLKFRGQGSGQNGIAVIKSQLRHYNINSEVLIFHDGSGLSARNQITSSSMAYFLSKINSDLELKDILETLPRGGYTGTVRGMFNNSRARGNVWLKSGSMEGIQSYSGYINSASGKWLSFSIIVNGFSVKGSVIRAKLEKLITDIYYSA